jgi:hypothetical protein
MKFWQTYAALALLLGLGAYIFLGGEPPPDLDDPSSHSEGKLFGPLLQAQIKEITVTRKGTEAFRVLKRGDNWVLATAEEEAPADPGVLAIMVHTITDTEIREVAAQEPTSLKEYGLENPHSKVEIKADGVAEPIVVEFGGKHPNDSDAFARRANGKPVFTFPLPVRNVFDKTAFDVLDRSPLHLTRDKVTTLDIKGPGGSVHLIKDLKGTWMFTKPWKAQASKDRVEDVLTKIEITLFDDLVDYDASTTAELKPYGLDKPLWTVVMDIDDGSSKKLEVGAKVPKEKWNVPSAADSFAPEKYYARDGARNLVGIIGSYAPDELAKALSGFMRSKRLLEFPFITVTQIEVAAGGERRSFVRSTERNPMGGPKIRSWAQSSPVTKTLDAKPLEALLEAVTTTDVTEIIDRPGPLAAYGLDAPIVRVELQFEKLEPAWFEIGINNDIAYGRRNDDDTVLELQGKAKRVADEFKRL